MKTKLTILFTLFIIGLIHSQKNEVEDLKEEFAEWRPVEWQCYQRDGSILLNPNGYGYDNISLLELVFEIENDFGYDMMWDDIDILKHFQNLIEQNLNIKCKKCNTYKEIKSFINTEKKAFTSQLSWVDPDDMRKGIKYTKKSDQLEKALIAYKKAEALKANEFGAKRKLMFTNWLLINKDRIKILSWDFLVGDQYYRDQKKEKLPDWIIKNYLNKAVSFFNTAYKNERFNRELRSTINSLSKKYNIFEGPTTDPKSKLTDQVLEDFVSSTFFKGSKSTSCNTSIEGNIFSPDFMVYKFFDSDDRKSHFLRAYPNLLLSGARHIKDKKEIINKIVAKSKEIKFIPGLYDQDWTSETVSGHRKYLQLTMAGFGGFYESFNKDKSVYSKLDYFIDTENKDQDLTTVSETKIKHQLVSSFKGKKCKETKGVFSMGEGAEYLVLRPNHHYTEGATGFKYYYENNLITKVEFYWGLGIGSDLVEKIPERLFSRQPAIVAPFKNNMLNGVMTVNMGAGNVIHPLISSVIVPDLKINGEKVFRYLIADSPFEIQKAELTLKNNLLHGPSKFFYKDKRNNSTGIVVVNFEYGLSELDIAKLEKNK